MTETPVRDWANHGLVQTVQYITYNLYGIPSNAHFVKCVVYGSFFRADLLSLPLASGVD